MMYRVGNICFDVVGETLVWVMGNMMAFRPFVEKETTVPEFTWVYEENATKPTVVKVQYSFFSEGVKSVFARTEHGYLLHMKQEKDGREMDVWMNRGEDKVNISGSLTPLMVPFGTWMAYGLMTVDKGRIAVHSSCIVNGDRGFLFLGESGTGKSTHTRLWREHVEGSVLLNDDSPIIVVDEQGVWVYGSPWSGKTPCYKQEKYRLGGAVRLKQAPVNRMKRLPVIGAYAALHPSCPPQFAYDDFLYGCIAETLGKVLEKVKCFELECLPNGEAANLSHKMLMES